MDFLKKLIGDLTSKYGLTNIAGTITAVLAGLTYVADTYLGCNIGAVAASVAMELSATCKLPSWFPSTWVPATLATAAAIAFVSKLFRPGTVLRNLFGGTAVIVPANSKASGENTVTPAQVASTK